MATLERLRVATRLHQCVANSDRMALTANRSERSYVDYLVKLYGFEAPLEAALSIVPEVAPLMQGQYGVSAALVAELCAHEFPAATLLEVPMFRRAAFPSTSAALGWFYVALRSRDSHELLRSFLAKRNPDLVQCSVNLRTSPELWQRLERALDRAADGDAVIAAALQAFDAQHQWLRPYAISGTAMHETVARAHVALRAPLLQPRFRRVVTRPEEVDGAISARGS